MRKIWSLFLGFVWLSGAGVLAQETIPSPSAGPNPAPRVFLDGYCPDRDYVRTEIPFVVYVRDRKDAEIHLLVTEQSGAAGSEYLLEFIGQGRFRDLRFTLRFFADRLATDDRIREGFVRVMKKGLMPFLARTDLDGMIAITYHEEEKAKPAPPNDPWDRWLFSLGLGGSKSGEESYGYGSYRISASANRVTGNLKIENSFSLSSSKTRYDYEDVEILTKTTSWRAGSLVVKSLGEHWSAGGWLQATASTYSNIASSFRVSPAVEYDFFPYSQSTRADLRILYRLAFDHNRYIEETIFDKMTENLLGQSLNVSLNLTQPWGSASASITGSHYFHDLHLNRVVLYGGLFLRIWKGFSFNVMGDYQLIHDQISIVKGALTEEEVLLRLKQLRTGYSYYVSIGISYSFGSVMSRSVNPRFGSDYYY
jgi:hypothetical protein